MPPDPRHSKLGGSVTARNVVVGGEVYSMVPADQAAAVARIVERAFDRMPVGWQPDDALANTVSVLRCAPLVEPLEDLTADVGGDPEVVVEDLTVTEASVVLGLSPRRVRELASSGALGGARQTSAGWLIPRSSIEGDADVAA